MCPCAHLRPEDALQHERAEGRQPSAGSHHDDGRGGVSRQPAAGGGRDTGTAASGTAQGPGCQGRLAAPPRAPLRCSACAAEPAVPCLPHPHRSGAPQADPHTRVCTHTPEVWVAVDVDSQLLPRRQPLPHIRGAHPQAAAAQAGVPQHGHGGLHAARVLQLRGGQAGGAGRVWGLCCGRASWLDARTQRQSVAAAPQRPGAQPQAALGLRASPQPSQAGAPQRTRSPAQPSPRRTCEEEME